MSIDDNLAQLSGQEIQERNLINHFLPFRQQRNKATLFDYDSVAGAAFGAVLERKITKGYGLDLFFEDCLERFKGKLSDDSFEDLIRQMYFTGDSLYSISPDFLLFKSEAASTADSKHLSSLFTSFLVGEDKIEKSLSSTTNFLEAELVAELNSHLELNQVAVKEQPYLPFIAKYFAADFRFLCEHPNYLLQNIRSFFGLYAFLYCSQLALNINQWDSTPESKPLYFILDTEKASIERKQVRGAYPWLKMKVADLFPLLSMLEYLNQPQNKDAKRYPLWKVVAHINSLDEVTSDGVCSDLKVFAESYRDKRGLRLPDAYPDSPKEMIGILTGFAKEVFSKQRSSQHTVNGRYVKAFEENIAHHFTQARGRSGRVLILNQDYLLLLTNISIGCHEQLQFQLLLTEFKKRGIWFDRQSEQALISFYERVGNVERKSDSGDAVYVRKTL